MTSSPLPAVTRLSRLVVLAVLLVAPAAQAQTGGALTGVYNGKYTCGQGLTNLKLSVVLSPIGDVSALFTFYLPVEAPTQGYTYSLHGQFDPRTGAVSLTPVRWETEHAANLGMVGLEGALNADRLSGRVTGGRCTTFDLTRDAGETAKIAAVIVAQKNNGKPITPSAWTTQMAAASASAPSPAPSTAAATTAPAANARPTTVGQPKAAPTAAPSAPAPSSAGGRTPKLEEPVLTWEMESGGRFGVTPHPFAHSIVTLPFTIEARVNCSQNGMSVFFLTDSADLQHDPAVFVWHTNSYKEAVTDVRVTTSGVSHTAAGYTNRQNGKWSPSEMGIFFYRPDLSQEAADRIRLQVRTGTPLDQVFGPLAQRAADAEVQEAQRVSGGPVTDLLTARSIRIGLLLGDWDTNLARTWDRTDAPPVHPWTDTHVVDLNPQHPVLHQFVYDCAVKMGVLPAPAPANTPPRTQAPSR